MAACPTPHSPLRLSNSRSLYKVRSPRVVAPPDGDYILCSCDKANHLAVKRGGLLLIVGDEDSVAPADGVMAKEAAVLLRREARLCLDGVLGTVKALRLPRSPLTAESMATTVRLMM